MYKNNKYLPLRDILVIVDLFKIWEIFLLIAKRKFLFLILTDKVFSLITFFCKKTFTVSTSGSSGMSKELQKKSKSSNNQDKQSKVERIFSGVSDKYDLMNDIMSFGLHRIWKQELIKKIKIKEQDIILDLATGSGDLLELIKKKSNCNCVGYDSNIKMMMQAKKKLKKQKIFYINGMAEKIPFKTNTFDFITLSFGLRNFTDIPKSLMEIKRVLKKKGRFYCLEFSEINNRSFRKIFQFYSKLIPVYGKLISDNEEAYSYLIQSIKEFPNQVQLTKKLLKAGFRNIEVFDILDGVASIHISEL